MLQYVWMIWGSYEQSLDLAMGIASRDSVQALLSSPSRPRSADATCYHIQNMSYSFNSPRLTSDACMKFAFRGVTLFLSVKATTAERIHTDLV